MICSSTSPPIRRRPGEGRGPRGFTLVELLVVILILAVLIALLLPAINGALRTAKNAAVGGEINQLAQALAAFKAKYGEYPPSRIYLAEDGNYSGVVGSNLPLGNGDITVGQLAQRSLTALRKYFPSVVLSTSVDVWGPNSPRWYDFNGDNIFAYHQHYILQGHECLVFFLGGIPYQNVPGNFSISGFGKDPKNPFTNNVQFLPNGQPNPMYSANRQTPLFEFANNRLVPDQSNPSPTYPAGLALISPQIPGYLDSLGNSLQGGLINYYAYFSAYGNSGYDPNDVNFATAPNAEVDTNGSVAELTYNVSFPVTGSNGCVSPAPNPYTSTITAPALAVTTYLNPQSFQIISAGIDGQYGVAGQYTPDNAEALPMDPNANFPSGLYFPYVNTQDSGIRIRERDNVTNFHNGKLE